MGAVERIFVVETFFFQNGSDLHALRVAFLGTGPDAAKDEKRPHHDLVYVAIAFLHQLIGHK
jgi:hypothetical protein